MNKKRLAVVGATVLAVVVGLLVLWLTKSGGQSHAPEFPPAEETVRAAAEKVGWGLDPEATQSQTDQVIYTLETGDQTRVSVSCASVDGDRVLQVYGIVPQLPDKPEFAWEDWKKAVTLAETLYGMDEGELYQALSEQDMPQPVIPEAGPDTRTGQESLYWDAELPSGYGQARWSISAGEVEHGFPEPTIRNWRVTFMLSLYESKDAYKSMMGTAER